MFLYDFEIKQWTNLSFSEYPQSLDEIKNYVINQIAEFSVAVRNIYCNGISPFEASSWTIKYNEAISSGPWPMLTIEANARGIPVQQLIDKVISAHHTLAQLEAQIAGTSGKHRDAISSLTTIEEVLNYNWTSGWPIDW